MIVLSIVFVVVLFGYAALMNAIVNNSKKLTQLEDSVISIQTKITQTEKDILFFQKLVTKESALAYGFVEGKEFSYIKTDISKTAFFNE